MKTIINNKMACNVDGINTFSYIRLIVSFDGRSDLMSARLYFVFFLNFIFEIVFSISAQKYF